MIFTELLDVEVTMDYLKQHSPVVLHQEGRIVFTDENEDVPWRCQPLSLSVTYGTGAATVDISTTLSTICVLFSISALRSYC